MTATPELDFSEVETELSKCVHHLLGFRVKGSGFASVRVYGLGFRV